MELLLYKTFVALCGFCATAALSLMLWWRKYCSRYVVGCSEYVLDLLEAERKFLLFAHHQEMLDAVEDAVRDKVLILFLTIKIT